MARGGFEPPKPLGRQIYSLLRLTAPQPRRCIAHGTTRPRAQLGSNTAECSLLALSSTWHSIDLGASGETYTRPSTTGQLTSDAGSGHSWRHWTSRVRPPGPQLVASFATTVALGHRYILAWQHSLARRLAGLGTSPHSRTGPRMPGHSPVSWKRSLGAGEGIRTPDPLITNQLLYRTELRQPDQTKILAQLMP